MPPADTVRRAAPHLALAALPVALYWRAVFAGAAFFERDIHFLWYGQARVLAGALRAPGWPLWTDVTGFGQPLLANPAQQVAYPLTWLLLVLAPERYYTLYVVVHLALFGCGLQLLARRLGMSGMAAWTAGAGGALSGPVLSLVHLWNHLAGVAWVPWVAWAVLGCIDEPGVRRALRLAGLVALQMVAGSVEMCVASTVLAAAVALPELQGGSARGRRVSLVVAGAAVLAMALGAVQWMPAAALASQSPRADLPAPMRAIWSVPPAGLVDAVLPLRLERIPWTAPAQRQLIGSVYPYLHSIYLGLPLLMLALVGAMRGRARARTALVVVALLATVFAAGPKGGLYTLAAAVLPPIRLLRFPAKTMVLVVPCACLLAGLGLDALSRARALAGRCLVAAALLALGGAAVLWHPPATLARSVTLHEAPPRGLRVVAPDRDVSASADSAAGVLGDARNRLLLTAVLLGAAALVLARWPSRAGVTLAAIALVDLALVHVPMNPVADPTLVTDPSAAARALRDDGHRAGAYDYLGGWDVRQGSPPLMPPAPTGWDARAWQTAVLRSYALPPVTMAFSVAGSFDTDRILVDPPHVRRLNALLARAAGNPATTLRLFQVAAVSRVASLQSGDRDGLRPLAVVPSLLDRPVQILGVPDALPRVYAVGMGLHVEDDVVPDFLLDPAFDPHQEVLLSGEALSGTQPFRGEARVASRGPDHVAIDAILSGDGYVVSVDAWDPGWRGTVDGRDVPVMKANGTFLAVAVPAGTHAVRLLYRPASVRVGAAVTAAALVVLVFGAVTGGVVKYTGRSAGGKAP